MDVTLLTPMPTSRIDELKEFCTKYRDLILNNNFDDLYHRAAWDPYIRSRDLTYLLMKTGIDPLKYMTRVFSMMFQGLGGFSTLTIPKNIEEIDNGAFMEINPKIRTIIIENKDIILSERMFIGPVDDLDIIYNGTMEDFENVVIKKEAFSRSKTRPDSVKRMIKEIDHCKITCTDGDYLSTI